MQGPSLKNRGVALVCVIIFIFVLTILGASILSLLLNQNRIIEHDISRIRALWAVESVFVKSADYLRRNDLSSSGLPGHEDFTWLSRTKRVNVTPTNMGNNLTRLNISIDYRPFL